MHHARRNEDEKTQGRSQSRDRNDAVTILQTTWPPEQEVKCATSLHPGPPEARERRRTSSEKE